MGYSGLGPAISAFVLQSTEELLWEWNGVDASQFDAPLRISSGTPSGWVPGVATTDTASVSPQPNGTRLVLPSSGNGTAGLHAGVYAINDAVFPTGKFKVEINSDIASVSTLNAGFGFFFWGDLQNLSNPYGYFYAPGGRVARADGSTTSILGNIATGSQVSNAQMTLRIEGRVDDPDAPHGQVAFLNRYSGARSTKILRNAFDANDGDYNFANLPTWGGAAAMDRFALCNWSTGGGGGAPTWYINSIRIYAL